MVFKKGMYKTYFSVKIKFVSFETDIKMKCNYDVLRSYT